MITLQKDIEIVDKLNIKTDLDKILNELKLNMDYYNNPTTYEDKEYYISCIAKVSAFEEAINIVKKYI